MTRRVPPPEEIAFLASYDVSAFERPSVAVDVVALRCREERLEALLVPRREHPFLDCYALPGGFVRMDEPLDAAARRLLAGKAGVEGVYLDQLAAFGAPDRDPRTRVVSVAYVALLRPDQATPSGEAGFFPLAVPWAGDAGGAVGARGPAGAALPIAFDHAEILGFTVQRLRRRLDRDPVAAALLPPTFTLRQLQAVHEAILGSRLNRDSFRRRLLATGQLEETGARETDVVHRPASLYRFRPES